MSDGPGPGPVTGAKRSGTRNLVEWAGVVGGALLAAFLVKTFLLQAFYIPSPSMAPTLHVNDRVLVNKLSYDLHGVGRGDIVVFRSPQPSPERDLIKRVVGLPGDTVEARGGTVRVNQEVLEEPYLEPEVHTTDFGPVTLEPGDYWVMGDNRPNSSDSRVFGAIEESDIVGRAFVRVWPLGDFGLL